MTSNSSKWIAGFVLIAAAFATPQAQAADNLQDLKAAAIAKFISEANTPNTKVSERIATINKDTTDDRNEKGTISLPVKAEDLQVVLLSSEVITSPWHYAVLKKNICSTNGVKNAQYMVLLKNETTLEDSNDYVATNFKIAVVIDQTFAITGGDPVNWNCEAIAARGSQTGPPTGKMGAVVSKLTTSDSQEVIVSNAKN